MSTNYNQFKSYTNKELTQIIYDIQNDIIKSVKQFDMNQRVFYRYYKDEEKTINYEHLDHGFENIMEATKYITDISKNEYFKNLNDSPRKIMESNNAGRMDEGYKNSELKGLIDRLQKIIKDNEYIINKLTMFIYTDLKDEDQSKALKVLNDNLKKVIVYYSRAKIDISKSNNSSTPYSNNGGKSRRKSRRKSSRKSRKRHI